MKTFKNMAAQGDLLIRRIDKLPDGLEPITEFDKNGNLVLAHSETGHNHVMERTHVQALREKGAQTASRDLYKLFLSVEEPTEIVHERHFDTHESLIVDKGIYEVRRQREYTPQGFRKAAD